MTKINGRELTPDVISEPEYASIGDSRLFRAACNLSLIKRGQPVAISMLGKRQHELAEERKRNGGKKIEKWKGKK